MTGLDGRLHLDVRRESEAYDLGGMYCPNIKKEIRWSVMYTSPEMREVDMFH
jgi:hypothetical protein